MINQRTPNCLYHGQSRQTTKVCPSLLCAFPIDSLVGVSLRGLLPDTSMMRTVDPPGQHSHLNNQICSICLSTYCCVMRLSNGRPSIIKAIAQHAQHQGLSCITSECLSAAPKHESQPGAANKSLTRLPSGLVIERAGGAWNWKQIVVSDDGQSLVALSSQEGPPSMWLWTASPAAAAQPQPANKVQFKLNPDSASVYMCSALYPEQLAASLLKPFQQTCLARSGFMMQCTPIPHTMSRRASNL